MKAIIKYKKTNRIETLEIDEIIYSKDKITLLFVSGGFMSFYHDQDVSIQIKKDLTFKDILEQDELNHAERQADEWSVEQGRG